MLKKYSLFSFYLLVSIFYIVSAQKNNWSSLDCVIVAIQVIVLILELIRINRK